MVAKSPGGVIVADPVVSFLFPLYLLGSLAVVVPIVLHLRRRPARDRIEFSSTLFLDPQDPPQRRSSRIEHWVLLALRCAALLFLALLFGRPLWRSPSPPAATPLTVRLFLLDRSASMRQTGAWDDALAAVQRLASETAPGDRIALAAFDRDLEVLVPFASAPDARNGFATVLSSLAPGWAGTSLDQALPAAVALVQAESRGRSTSQEILLISDFQESSARERLGTFAWPPGLRLTGVPVPTNPGPRRLNASLQVVASASEEDEPAPGPRNLESIRLRLARSHGGPGDAVLSVRWKDQPASAVEIRLPPGASRVLSAPPRPSPEATELELTGDAEPFDNRAFVAPRRARLVRILYTGPPAAPGDTTSPLFFLSRSLTSTETLRPEVRSRPVGELTGSDWKDVDVVVLAGRPDAQNLQSLRQFIGEGGTAVLLLPDAISSSWLTGLERGFAVSEAPVKDYALFGEIDFDHPVFRPFAIPGLRDFSKIHTWKHRLIKLPPKARILARFDSQAPALVEWPLGQGRIFLSAFNWVPSDSQLPLSSKFVPLVYAMLGEAGFRHREPDRYLVGDVFPGKSGAPFRATAPGLFPTRDGVTERLVACNLPPGESRLETFPVESLAALGIPVGAPAQGGPDGAGPPPLRLQAAESEGEQRLWRWLLPILLLLLLLETWWANHPRPALSGSPAA